MLAALLAAMVAPRPVFAAGPAISIRDASMTEGGAGLHRLALDLRLTAATARGVSVHYRTRPASRLAQGSKAAARLDYVSGRGVLRSIPPNVGAY